jgi:ribosomal protein L7/L12
LAGVSLVVCGVLVVAGLQARERLEARIRRLEARLDAVITQSGIAFDPGADVLPEVLRAVREGRVIEAIRFQRKATGMGLREAKDYVDDLMRKNAPF